MHNMFNVPRVYDMFNVYDVSNVFGMSYFIFIANDLKKYTVELILIGMIIQPIQ